MNEGITEEKMNRVDFYKYHVVKLLKSPIKDNDSGSCNYICVPRTWAKWCSPRDHLVKIWYPPQDSCDIEEKVENIENKSEQWEFFFGILKYSTNSYANARREVLECNGIEDRTPIPATVEEKTSKTTSSVIENEATVNSTQDALASRVSLKTANTLKRKTNDFDTSSHLKRSRENEPSESVDEVAGPSSQAMNEFEFEFVKSNDRNTTDQIQIMTQNASTANYSLDPKLLGQLPILGKCCEVIQELQKRLGFSLVQKIINKLLNLDSDDDNNDCGKNDCGKNDCGDDIGLIENNELFKTKSPQQIRKVAPKLDITDSKQVDLDDSSVNNQQRKKENIYPLPIIKEVVSLKYNANKSVNGNGNNNSSELLKTKSSKPIKKVPPRVATMMRKDDPDYGGDDIERRKKKKFPLGPGRIANVCSSPQQKSFVLPPEYDANDSRWTLKYREFAEGLVELMEHSGVYVDASRLTDCKEKAKTGDKLCEMLLSEVFTESALSTCTLTGKKTIWSKEINVRPGLDAHAREVILDFIANQEKKGLRTPDRQFLALLMTNKLKAMRRK